ncbi:uncharacterized protein At2g34160-like isoform X2 [Curcuma longa]|uniref:uncharacterized protein At2g34160-like isoform X2 n=1 Tax=Curcuma longa TaxID=136217 RepID=UPI003D9F19DD
MEEVTEGVNNIQISDADGHKKNRIQVSNTKKPLFFYVNLAKRYMQQHNEVELSALGMETQSYHSVNSFIILLLRWMFSESVLFLFRCFNALIFSYNQILSFIGMCVFS